MTYSLDNKIPIHIITLLGNPIAEHYLDQIEPTWHLFGYENTRLFNGITPETIEERCPIKLDFIYKRKEGRKPKYFTPTEKACWYSHYYLWRKIRREGVPAIVAEHDCKLMQQLPITLEQYDIRSFALHNTKPCLMAASAYYLTPKGADQLIENLERIIQNVDGYILNQPNQTPFKKNIHNNTYAQVIYDKKIGATINHGK
jgi:GR25 family glycosyltransferase involved in LPS biosynthesis